MSKLAITRAEHKRDYFSMTNAAARDRRLSLEARGLLALMLSHADGYVMDTKALEAEGIGQWAQDRVLAELSAAGYAKRERVQRAKGLWYWQFTVSESGDLASADKHVSPISEKTQHRGNSKVGENPKSGKPTDEVLKKNQNPKKNQNTKKDSKKESSSSKTKGKKDIAANAAPAIPAKEFQTAFIAAYGYTDAAYKDTVFLRHIKSAYTIMDGVGLTPTDVPDFYAYAKEQNKGRAPLAQYLKDHVLAFESYTAKQREVDALYYSVKPCPEFPAGLPAGISPDDPRADIYRFSESDPDDPEVAADIAAKGKEQDEFTRKYLPTFAA
jgi:hypothetical protein